VNGIIGMTELAMQTDLTPAQRDYLQTINSCAESLLAQLNDVLDFSKIEAGKLELERTDFSLRELLGEALSTLAPRAHAKGLELLLHIRPEVPESLIGDPHRLRQIVVNLVGNAVKFTEKGDILVRVENSRWVDGEAELAFTVADSGIGIRADRIATIFQPFSQADYSTTRRFGGTGLGLAITQQLVGLMRGAVKVESEVDRGSVFRFTARFAYHKPADHEQDHTLESFKNLRVLILEPHAISMRIATELLTTWQIRADQARDAVTAVKQLRAAAEEGKPYDLFIGDAVRAESAGLKVASTISSYSELTITKVMLLVSAPNRNESDRFGASIHATLVKPVTARSLRAAIAKAMECDKSKGKMVSPKTTGVPAQRPLKVLVAEDNAVNQRLAKLNLEGWGHTVIVAGDGQEAVDQYEKSEFDLILMDLQMPRLSGFEAAIDIRQREKNSGRQRTPILALSANVLKGVRDECAKSGMDGYVSKPVRQQELLGAMSLVIANLFSDAAAGAGYLDDGEPKTTQPPNATSTLFTAPVESAPVAAAGVQETADAPTLLDASPTPVVASPPATISPPSGLRLVSAEPAPSSASGVRPAPVAAAAKAVPVQPLQPSPVPETPADRELVMQPVSAPEPGAVPGPTFDAAALMENLGNDKAVLAEVVRLCRSTDVPRLLKDLADSLAAGSCQAAAKAAHGLKGMVGAFNATTAWNLAKHLETSAREQRLEVLLADADEFIRALRALLEDLERFAEIEHKFIEWI
jgi:CheY-like chemotaxis protein